MRYRPLGNSGLSLSEIGFGAWGIGGVTPGPTSYGHTNDSISLEALYTALDSGINFYDTSNVYGYGHSERLIGKAFSHQRSKVIIATKVGFVDYITPPDFSASAVYESVIASLKRLNTDYIDLLQLHNPSSDWLKKNPETIAKLLEVQSQGKVRELGISVKTPDEAFALLELFPFKSVQANFNMLDIRARECGLFNKLEMIGAGFIARTPMAFGFLAGEISDKQEFPDNDHRSRWGREQIKLWVDGAIELQDCCQESIKSPAYEVALRFCLSYPQISSIIPGMLSSEEVKKNIASTKAGALSDVSCLNIQQLHKSKKFFL